MVKQILKQKINPKYNDATQYRELFAPDFAVGWNALNKHLAFILPNQKFDHFKNHSNKCVLDNIAVCKLENGSQYFVSYGLSQLYYDESYYGNLISKYGFEITLNIKQNSQQHSLYVFFEVLQNIAKLIIEDDIDIFNKDLTVPLSLNIVKLLKYNYHYFSLKPDSILKKMGSSHGEHQFIEIILLA